MSKTKTLGVFCPSKTDATSFYRGLGPLGQLRRSYHRENLQFVFLNEVNWSNLKLIDYMFMQRPFTDEHLLIAQLGKRQSIPLWVDYDDLLFAVPEDNPTFGVYGNEKIQANIKQLLRLADVVSVSTPELLVQLSQYTDRCILVRNALDDFMFPYYGKNIMHRASAEDLQRLVLWRGSNTHSGDLDTCSEAVIELAEKHKDWNFMFVGDDPWFTRFISKAQKIVIRKPLDIYEYMDLICQVHPALMIVPLADNIFNRCKSDCAWLEGTFAGATVLAPDFQTEFDPAFCKKYLTAQNSQRGFSSALDELLQSDLTELFAFRENAWQNLVDNRLLSKENLRSAIIDHLWELRC